MAEDQLKKVRELFDLYDSDADNSLSLNELAVLLQEIGNKITALPAVRLHDLPHCRFMQSSLAHQYC